MRGTVDGTPFRTTVAVYGGRHYIGFRKELRDAAGIAIGDEVAVELELDEAERRVEPPPELDAALVADAAAAAAFWALSYTHQREFAVWIADAKRPETRERRIARTIELLQLGKHR